MDVATLPTIADVRAAAERIRPHVHATPVITCRYFDRAVGATIFFKCENLQKVGAFKSRGACNAVFSLPDDRAAAGVATHSSGNHGQAVAFAARLRGIPATVVMPRGTTDIKRRAVQGYGAPHGGKRADPGRTGRDHAADRGRRRRARDPSV